MDVVARTRVFWELVRGVPKGVNLLCIASVVVLLVKVFWLNRLPAAFEGAQEAGVLVDAILTSVVASYVFYLLTSRLPEFEKQRVFAPYVQTKAKQARGACESLLKYIGDEVGETLDIEVLDRDTLRGCLARIVPTAKAPFMVGNRDGTWLELINHECVRARGNAEQLQEKSPFLDAEVALAAGRVVEAQIFKFIETIQSQPLKARGSEFLTSTLYTFFQDCRSLRKAGLKFAVAHVPPEPAAATG